MKKRLLSVLLTLALLLTMTACSAAGTARKLDVMEDRIEHKLDAAEDTVEQALRKAADPAPETAKPAPTEASVPTEAPAPAQSAAAPATITREEAEKIALDHNGFSAGQVTRMHSEFEYDDGIPQYDVEYHEGDWEYEFEINAENGRIISFDKDHKYD